MVKGFLIFVYLAIIGIISSLFSHVDLIVDEVFHVKQAQAFILNGILKVEYNSKITTPPGPYLISWSIYKISRILGIEWDVTPYFLRCTNLIYASAMPFVLQKILNSDLESAIESSLFPPLFFFHFLYYTDSGSVFWVLVSYLASRKKSFGLAAIASFVAISFRQTNIVWMILIMGLAILDLLIKSNLNPNFKDFILFIATNYRFLIKKLWGFILNGLLFGLFLIWNNGIVIGDKGNHVAVLHVPQIYYFSVFLVFFSWDYKILLDGLAIFKKPIVGVGLGCLMGWTILYYTIEHPFLLSDNRHFSFYIWRWFFKGNLLNRLLVIPVYMVAIKGLFLKMGKVLDKVSILGYCIAVILTLIPSPLLEFRYFIMPFYFFRILTFKKSTKRQIVLNILVNAIVFWIFLFKTFDIESESGPLTQRFMW